MVGPGQAKMEIYKILTFTCLWANSADDKLMMFFFFIFPRKYTLTIYANCFPRGQFVPKETICMKCQCLISKKKKKIKMVYAKIFTQHAKH